MGTIFASTAASSSRFAFSSLNLARVWERVSFRIYGMFAKDARTKVGDYVRLAWSALVAPLAYPDLRARITQIGADHPIADAVENLRNTDCYSEWQAELRYFFYRYEEHLSRQAKQNFSNEQWSKIWASSAADSIEHIRPQKKASHDPKTKAIYAHRLGNLVLLPPRLNSKLQDAEPSKKHEAYVKTGLLIAQHVARAMNEWDRAAVDAREATGTTTKPMQSNQEGDGAM